MKIPAEFAPQSWEMPPSARVLEDSASVVARNFSGRTLKWIVALVESTQFASPVVWTRPLDLNFDAGFVAFQCCHRQLMPKLHHIDSALGETLTNLWQSNQLARYFFFNEKGDLRKNGESMQDSLLVAPNGVAAWTGKEIQKISNAIAFDWGAQLTNKEFLQLPMLELWKRMQNDTSSELSSARQFANMDDEERHQLVWGNSCISQEKMEMLLKVLITGQHFWVENPEIMNVSVDVYTGQDVEMEISVEQGIHYEALKFTDELLKESQLLANRFRPPSDFDVEVERNSYRGIWISARAVNFEFEISRPTSHEQLEAKLRWREWKAQHEKL